MDEKDLEFDLEDIIKEFSDAPDKEEPEKETPAEEKCAEEKVPDEAAADETPSEEKAADETPAAPAGVTSDTIRLDTIVDMQGQVRHAAIIHDEEEAPAAQKQTAEPFSEEWEPEYDQPIAEYVPAAPIVFRPKSRLREIKRQLVAGPEKQYYLLVEKGLGKLQAAIFFSLLVVLLSAGATALYALNAVPDDRMRLMVFGQFMAMLICALLGSFQLIEGAADLFHRRFSLNSLLLFTFVLCLADGILCLQQLRVPCCAAFSLQVTMSLWSTYQQRNTRLGQLDTMRKATQLSGLHAVQDYCEGATGILRGQGEVEHFMNTYTDAPEKEKTLSVYALVALLVSIATGVLAGVLHGVGAGLQVASVTALAAMPASMFVICSRPMAVLERRLHSVGTVFCGWQGAAAMAEQSVFPIDHNDLFPAGSVLMNGVKFFSGRQPDEIIAYASALIHADGGSLAPLFAQLLESRNGVHYDVSQFNRYDGGIGGEVNGEAVLAGSLSFLKRMGVELPEGIRVHQAVCVAVDGELCGLFAVTYSKDKTAAAGITTLCGYRRLRPVLMTGDLMLTPGFIRSTFGVNTKRILFTDDEQRAQLQQKLPQEDSTAAALITGEGLAAYAYAATGARSLKTAVTWGAVIHLIGGILGMLMMLALAYLGATYLLTPANLFLYELVWMVPGLLVTELTRNI